jgi:hypothetical protein
MLHWNRRPRKIAPAILGHADDRSRSPSNIARTVPQASPAVAVAFWRLLSRCDAFDEIAHIVLMEKISDFKGRAGAAAQD